MAALLGRDLPAALAWVCGGAGLCAVLTFLILYFRLPAVVRPGAFSVPGRFLLGGLALLTVGACLFRYGGALAGEMLPAEGLDGKEVRVRGVVLDYPEESYHKCYYRLRVERVLGEEPLDVPKFTLRLSSWQAVSCEPGDVLECTVNCWAFDGSGGLYSQRNTRWAKGEAVGGYVSGSGAVVSLRRTERPPELAAVMLRHRLARGFERLLPREEAGLIRAMLLGEKHRAPDGAYEDFRQIGASHLLVISGLHMAAMSAFVSLLTGRLRFLKRRTKNLINAGFILTFLSVTGFPPSAVRSGVMLLVFLLADCAGRRTDSVNSLGFAVFVICLWDPFSGGDLGFALSVFATLGILLFADRISRAALRPFRKRPRLSRVMTPAAASLGVTLAALFGTLPIQLAVFQGVPLLSPLANLILVLPCTLLLYLALAGAVLGLIGLTGLASPVVFCAGWLARLAMAAAKCLARVPASFWSLSRPESFLEAALLLSVVLGVWVLSRDRAGACVALTAALLLRVCGGALGTGWSSGTVTLAAAPDSSCVVVIKDRKAAVLSLGGFRTGAASSLLSRNNVTRLETLCLPVRDQEAQEAAMELLNTRGADRLVIPDSAYLGRGLILAGKRSERVPLREGESVRLLEGVEARASQDMKRLDFSVNGISVIVERGGAGEGACHVLFTTEVDSRINSSFTILQNDDILEPDGAGPGLEQMNELPAGRYCLPAGDGLYLDLLPDGTVKLRGESLCPNWENLN